MTSLSDEQCLQATTWRKDGTPVMTPIWPLPWEGDRIAFVTPKLSGKHKRLNHTPRIKLQASDWDGFPLDGSTPVEGSVECVDGAALDRAMGLLFAKYGDDAWDAAMVRAKETFASKGMEYPGDIAVIVTPDA